MIQWPPTVVDDIARRRSVIFLGAGISRQAQNAQGVRPKMWKEFLQTAVAQCPAPTRHITTLITQGDYLTACEIIRDKLGPAFNRLVSLEFSAPGFRPAKIHELVFRLDSRIVATPNFDKIYDAAAMAQSNATVKVKNFYDPDVASTIRGDDFVILKVHGTVDSPDRLIFTRQQYTNARYEFDQFYGLLDALALTHTFLFLGAGLNDPDIRLLLENHAYRYPKCRPHVMAAPKGSLHADVQAVVERTLNLQILTYDPAQEHKELLDSVQDLVTQVEARRADFAQSLQW